MHYKELLKKYIGHVSSMEGTDFLNDLSFKNSAMIFTKAEIKELEELSDGDFI